MTNVLFIAFADAFSSVKHDFLFQTISKFEIPEIYCCLIEDLYKYSSFSISCAFHLSKKFYIVRGTNTGDP